MAIVMLWGLTLLVGSVPAGAQADTTVRAPRAAPDQSAPAAPSNWRVLLLYPEPWLVPGLANLDDAIRKTLQSQADRPIHFYAEYLDLSMFNGDTPQEPLRALFRRKCADRHLDLVIAASSRLLRIALHNRADLFGAAPIVFTSVIQQGAADLQLPPDVTGAWLRLGWSDTLETALRLQPRTRRAVVVTGLSSPDLVWQAAARAQLASFQGRIDVTYLSDITLEDLLSQVAVLPDDSVVLIGSFRRDRAGGDFMPAEASRRIASASRVPTYGLTESMVGSGVVGGHALVFSNHGEITAELALRVLQGQRPPVIDRVTSVGMFDWRQLQRWKLDPGRLPPGSVIRFRQESPWERYRWWIVGAGALVTLQSAFLTALLVQRAQRRRSQRSLAERLKFETFLSDLSARLSTCPAAKVDGQIEGGLRGTVENLGADHSGVWTLQTSADEIRLAHAWIRPGVPPLPPVIRESDAPQILFQLREGHVVRIDGESFAPFGGRSTAVVPLMVGDSVVGGLSIGTAHEARGWHDELLPRLRLLADLFANALARQEAERTAGESATQIRNLAGQLISAQEEERSRIARELHDGINQKLAALSIALGALGRRPPSSLVDLPRELDRLQQRATVLVDEVRHLSHELHPGVLQHIGLVAALQGYCSEFESEHQLKLTFEADEGVSSMPDDLALCLYRATQEALGNIAKHAGADQVRVSIAHMRSTVILTVADDGCGFDLTEARGRAGLGLISLEERARLVGGHVQIDSGPHRGTKVRIVLPLPEDLDGSSDRSPR